MPAVGAAPSSVKLRSPIVAKKAVADAEAGNRVGIREAEGKLERRARVGRNLRAVELDVRRIEQRAADEIVLRRLRAGDDHFPLQRMRARVFAALHERPRHAVVLAGRPRERAGAQPRIDLRDRRSARRERRIVHQVAELIAKRIAEKAARAARRPEIEKLAKRKPERLDLRAERAGVFELVARACRVLEAADDFIHLQHIQRRGRREPRADIHRKHHARLERLDERGRRGADAGSENLGLCRRERWGQWSSWSWVWAPWWKRFGMPGGAPYQANALPSFARCCPV